MKIRGNRSQSLNAGPVPLDDGIVVRVIGMPGRKSGLQSLAGEIEMGRYRGRLGLERLQSMCPLEQQLGVRFTQAAQ